MPDLGNVIKVLESLRDICNAKSNMAIGNGKVAWAGYANTTDDAIALLKKQVPIPVKDVQWHEVTRKRMINGICPSCNSIITHFNGSGFCDKCGQAVKWE